MIELQDLKGSIENLKSHLSQIQDEINGLDSRMKKKREQFGDKRKKIKVINEGLAKDINDRRDKMEALRVEIERIPSKNEVIIWICNDFL